MKTKVTKWGNSYAVRLPKHMVDEMELAEDIELLLEKKGEGFLITKPSKKEQLENLLKDIEPQKELDWGQARGKEAW